MPSKEDEDTETRAQAQFCTLFCTADSENHSMNHSQANGMPAARRRRSSAILGSFLLSIGDDDL